MTAFTRSQWLAAGAASFVLAPRIARAQSLDTIQVVGTPADDLTPLLYGIQSGLYARNGLNVQYVASTSGSAAAAAVVSGSYQMGAGSFLSSLLAYLRNVPLAVVANGGMWDPKFPFAQILVAADSPIKTAADLNGKIAGSPSLNDLNSLAISSWMDKAGGDPRSIKFVEIPNSAAAEALNQRRIDVYVLNEPQLTAATTSGRMRAIAPAYSSIGEHFVFQLYFANPDWAQKNRDVLRRWVKATYEAAAYTNANESNTAQMMADVTKIPVDMVRKMVRVPAALTSDPRLLQPAIDSAAKYKSISRPFRAEELYFKI